MEGLEGCARLILLFVFGVLVTWIGWVKFFLILFLLFLIFSFIGLVQRSRKSSSKYIEQLAARGDIEGLGRVLGDPKNNLNIRTKAAIALGNIGDSQAVQILTTVLGESPLDQGREYVRQTAAKILIEIGSPAVEPLFDSLRTSFDLKKWEAVAYVLVQIGSPAVQPLLDALRNSSFTADNWGSQQRLDAARQVATHVLANIVPRPVDSLISAIGYCDFAIEALVRYGAASVEPLIAALGDTTNPDVREKAAYALGKIGDGRAVEPLIAALGDTDSDVRKKAAEALGQLNWQPGPNEAGAAYWIIKGRWDECVLLGTVAVQPLITALGDTDWSVRRQAAEVLGRIGDAQAVEPLITALGDTDWSVRGIAAEALVQIGVPSVVPLIVALGDSDLDVRRNAAEALVQIGLPSVEPLIAALVDTAWRVRKNAAYALGKIGDGRAVDALVAALGDADSDVRRNVAEALERLHWQPEPSEVGATYWIIKGRWDKCVELGTIAVQPLIAALGDIDLAVRISAAETLVQIGVPSVEPLIAALGDTGLYVRKMAAYALGKIGDGRAVEPLIAALGGTDSNVCHQAAIALERLHWQPEQIEASAPYYVFTHQWDKCVELGTVAVPPLIDALQDTDSDVLARGQAALALGKIGDERAVEPLIANLRDLRPKEVRWGAAQGLAMLYRSGNLDQSMKRMILSHRETMARPHTDNHVDHDDVTSECNTRTNFHTDHGIGVYL